MRSLLDELGILQACASAFDKEKVDLAALAGLADGNLQALGVVRLGDRRGLKVRAQALLASTMGWSGLGEEKPGVRDADDGDPLPSSSKLLQGKVAVQNWADTTGTEMHKKDENRPEEPAFTTVRRSGVDYRDPPLPIPEPVEHKRVEGVEEEFGRPTNNWGDWEEDKGRYQGEWKGGEFHGQGTYVWRSGNALTHAACVVHYSLNPRRGGAIYPFEMLPTAGKHASRLDLKEDLPQSSAHLQL